LNLLKLCRYNINMISDVPSAVRIHVVVLWVMIVCSPVCRYQCFGGTYCVRLQVRSEPCWEVVLHLFSIIVYLLNWPHFLPEDGGCVFFQNFGTHLPAYTMS
jgi:hypothetical protein